EAATGEIKTIAKQSIRDQTTAKQNGRPGDSDRSRRSRKSRDRYAQAMRLQSSCGARRRQNEMGVGDPRSSRVGAGIEREASLKSGDRNRRQLDKAASVDSVGR